MTLRTNLNHLVARRSDTIRPPDEAAGCCHCLYDVDSVGAVEWSKPGAATAYMTVEKVKNGEEEKRRRKRKTNVLAGGKSKVEGLNIKGRETGAVRKRLR